LWFIEPLNEITRNAIAQSLQLVDHEGECIYYGGKPKHGFKVPFEQVLFLHGSKSSGTWKYTAYHKENKNKPWVIWKGGKKGPNEQLRDLGCLFLKKGTNPLKQQGH
jgi:hypothetical protein